MLITAIYTESMVVAASLSQIQNLLLGATLQNKPDIRDTLDKALTGCWVVYQCLDEEVQELNSKMDVNDLRKRDRARFLLKEANFKDLLQQIRGQQSALGLLIQGLQMESLSDMHRLIGDNSAKLDHIARRSNTLRQKHPNIKVPESIIDQDSIHEARSIFGDAEFAFDDEVVNSKAYRRAMAQAEARVCMKSTQSDAETLPGDLIRLKDDPSEAQTDFDAAAMDMETLMLQVDDAIESHSTSQQRDPQEAAESDFLDDLEKSLLPFMPPVSLAPKPAVLVTKAEPTQPKPVPDESIMTTETTDSTLVASVSQESDLMPVQPPDELDGEKPPPLPPRRPSSFLAAANSSNSSELKKASSWEDIFAPLSNTSSLSLTDPSAIGTSRQLSETPKPLPLLVKKSSNLQPVGSGSEETSDSARGTINPDDVWTSVRVEEETYIARLNILRTTFHDAVVSQWPALEKHLEAIILVERLVPYHQEYICDPLKEKMSSQSSNGDPRVFSVWASKAYKVLKEYSQRYPHALYALRLTQTQDKKFDSYIENLGLGLSFPGKNWEDYLALPITQLESYTMKLQSLNKHVQERSENFSTKEQRRLKDALAILQRLREQCSGLQAQSIGQEELQNLYRRIHSVDTKLLDMLEIFAADRKIVLQAPLAIKLNGHGQWKSVHIVLLDNYLFWGKVKQLGDRKLKERKGDSILLVDQVSLSVIVYDNPSPGVRTNMFSLPLFHTLRFDCL